MIQSHGSRTMVGIFMELLYLWNREVTESLENTDDILNYLAYMPSLNAQ